jgi:magnesium-transporting ATPase (P-type)
VRQYADPMQIVLLVAGIVSLYPLKELETGLVLIFLTLFNAVLGLQQEGKAAAAVAALQKMMIVRAKVTRGGELAQIPAEQLVPGDIVAIEAGDIVPADGRLLRAATLEVAESALTGESLPVAKGTNPVTGAGTPLGDRTDMVYLNTNVTRGSGEFVVTAPGMATEVGHISGMLQAEEAVKTPLTRQLDKLTHQILWIAGLIAGAGTLGVLSWAEQVRTEAVAHTMGVVTFSMFALFFSIATKDERRTVFSLDTFADKTFNIATGVSVLTLILSTVFGTFQKFLATTSLDIEQWVVCTGVAASIIVISEIRKAIRRRKGAEAAPAGQEAPSPAAAA